MDLSLVLKSMRDDGVKVKVLKSFTRDGLDSRPSSLPPSPKPRRRANVVSPGTLDPYQWLNGTIVWRLLLHQLWVWTSLRHALQVSGQVYHTFLRKLTYTKTFLKKLFGRITGLLCNLACIFSPFKIKWNIINSY